MGFNSLNLNAMAVESLPPDKAIICAFLFIFPFNLLHQLRPFHPQITPATKHTRHKSRVSIF
uniref:Uncharacterized protein n=1 Tax=uncultured marine virus TaxID=186617 RepID=A0A0F7L4U4_9VIRU|nr:hypothetical protein [uncultured marine virus]